MRVCQVGRIRFAPATCPESSRRPTSQNVLVEIRHGLFPGQSGGRRASQGPIAHARGTVRVLDQGGQK